MNLLMLQIFKMHKHMLKINRNYPPDTQTPLKIYFWPHFWPSGKYTDSEKSVKHRVGWVRRLTPATLLTLKRENHNMDINEKTYRT